MIDDVQKGVQVKMVQCVEQGQRKRSHGHGPPWDTDIYPHSR